MQTPTDRFRQVVEDLAATGFDFALVGALAVGVRAEERFTKDIDFAVSVATEQDVRDCLRSLLKPDGYKLVRSPEGHPELDVRPMATITPVVSDGPGILVDLLFNLCGIEADVVANAERMELLPGLVAKVATRGDLIAMKTLSLDDARRVRDRGDLAALLGVASQQDVDQACEALQRMEELDIGKMFGKDDLQAELRQHCSLYAPALTIGRDREMDRDI